MSRVFSISRRPFRPSPTTVFLTNYSDQELDTQQPKIYNTLGVVQGESIVTNKAHLVITRRKRNIHQDPADRGEISIARIFGGEAITNEQAAGVFSFVDRLKRREKKMLFKKALRYRSQMVRFGNLVIYLNLCSN